MRLPQASRPDAPSCRSSSTARRCSRPTPRPIDALCGALAARGLAPAPLMITSLKDPEAAAFIRGALERLAPAVIVTTTAFAACGEGEASPLDAVDAPVLQAVIATTRRDAWRTSPRGLGPADLAMHVVLPELDGRVLAGAIAFKDALPKDDALCFTAFASRPEPDRVAMVADRIEALVRLKADEAGEAPHRGVDAGLSGGRRPRRLCRRPRRAGKRRRASRRPRRSRLWRHRGAVEPVGIARSARGRRERARDFAATSIGNISPRSLDDVSSRVEAAWGAPARRSRCSATAPSDSAPPQFGNVLVALPPERGRAIDRRATYHDPNAAAAPCRARFRPVAARRGQGRCDRAYGRARHARMAAGEGRGADRLLLPRGRGRAAAGDLPLHRQQSGRGGAGQAPHRRRHHRPSAAALDQRRALWRGAGARAPGRRICHRRRARPAAARASGAAHHRDRAQHRARDGSRRLRATFIPTRPCARSTPGCAT